MNWRPKGWKNPVSDVTNLRPKYNKRQAYLIYEAGADAILKAIMEARPSDSEIRVKIIEALYGGTSVPELEKWLKERLLLKP